MKPKAFLLLFFIATGCFAKAADGIGEQTSRKADIAGGVYDHDSKKGLGNVSITVYAATKKEKVVLTDEDGRYTFDDLKAGTYKFVFEKDGYKKVTREKVVVQPDAGVQLNIEMTEHATFELLPGPYHFSDFN